MRCNSTNNLKLFEPTKLYLQKQSKERDREKGIKANSKGENHTPRRRRMKIKR
jgi:hypothetical protein